MASTSITIRMDKTLKEQAEELFESMGMNMTTAFTVFARAVVLKGKIPFDVEASPFYSEANQIRLRKAIADLDAGMGREHELPEAGA
ncbi:DNA-damage-inducible protein J [Spirochaetia bacterium]|nr:DNA-damage-inducible protein J [Spirochaetia bacterium]GHU32977.1 DNA-damage-inducible protein J [Spirochaetia bacterium]GHU47010.1 DNA-damage-inducible protein J [Spirochaetia bacterium]